MPRSGSQPGRRDWREPSESIDRLVTNKVRPVGAALWGCLCRGLRLWHLRAGSVINGGGTGPGTEQWPFIAADSDVFAEPGKVLAFECPWYITGLGGFIVENQLLITGQGVEVFNRLPTGLVSL